MTGITQAQLRKIWFLAREHGIDEDTLHAHVLSVAKKDSLKKLTIHEAVKVIDSLKGVQDVPAGMASYTQKNYIFGLAKELGWMDDCGNVDEKRLNAFLRSRFEIEVVEWLTVKAASMAIEALKAMKERQNNTAKEAAPNGQGELAEGLDDFRFA